MNEEKTETPIAVENQTVQKRHRVAYAAVAVFIALVGIATLVTRETHRPIDTSQQQIATVTLSDDGATPQVLTIKAGAQVTWNNEDSDAHRIAADPFPSHSELPSLDSKTNMAPGGS